LPRITNISTSPYITGTDLMTAFGFLNTELRAVKNVVNHLYDLTPKTGSQITCNSQTENYYSARIRPEIRRSDIVVALVARDSTVHQKIAGLLSALNIQISFYKNGQSLAKSHQLQRSHCLIIETELDDMLGVSLFKKLLSANQGVPPTIFITVRPGSTKEAVEAMTLGAVDYIEHPFFARQLINSLALALAA